MQLRTQRMAQSWFRGIAFLCQARRQVGDRNSGTLRISGHLEAESRATMRHFEDENSTRLNRSSEEKRAVETSTTPPDFVLWSEQRWALLVPGVNSMIDRLGRWLDRLDPGVHRRVKGLRLVTAYGIAAMLGALLYSSYHISGGSFLSYLAAGFGLWASVSEGQPTRWLSTRDLVILNAAAVTGALSLIGLAPIFDALWSPGSGVDSDHGRVSGWISQAIRNPWRGHRVPDLYWSASRLRNRDHSGRSRTGSAGGISSHGGLGCSSLAQRTGGTSDACSHCGCLDWGGASFTRTADGVTGSSGRFVIVLVSSVIHLQESAWAITASTYVIAGSASGTEDRVRRRIVGTLIGVPLGIACVPIATHIPPLAWILAAIAMIIYAMALPERYDIACAAYAFTLMVTLAISGETSTSLLGARAWETLLGGLLGVAAAKVILPLPGDARSDDARKQERVFLTLRLRRRIEQRDRCCRAISFLPV